MCFHSHLVHHLIYVYLNGLLRDNNLEFHLMVHLSAVVKKVFVFMS